jgi:glycosyltransferase involved in cell wall biosynthesis
VLESLRFGRAVVATDHACRGYDNHLPDRKAVWIAHDENGLADGCIRLLRDPVLRQAMAREGCARVEQYFSFDRFAKTIAEAFELPPPTG